MENKRVSVLSCQDSEHPYDEPYEYVTLRRKDRDRDSAYDSLRANQVGESSKYTKLQTDQEVKQPTSSPAPARVRAPYIDMKPPYENSFIIHITSQTKAAISEDQDLFVSTSNYTLALDLLAKHKVIIITGPPGSGKTAIGRALLRHYGNEGYIPLQLHRFQDFEFEPKKSAILLDNVFGGGKVDPHAYRGWAPVFRSLVHFTRDRQNLTVIIMYLHTMKQLVGLPDTQNCFKNLPVIDLSVLPLTTQEKTNMVRRHATSNKQYATDDEISHILTIDRSGPVFPWCCREYTRPNDSVAYHNIQPTAQAQPRNEAFSSTVLAYVPLFLEILRDPERQQGLFQMLALIMKGQGSSSAKNDLKEIQEKLKDLDLDTDAEKMTEMISLNESFRGSLLDDNGTKFRNRSIYDSFGFALYEVGSFELLLRVCDVKFLVQHVHIEPQETGQNILLTPKSPPYFTFVFRAMKEIVSGNCVAISQHPALHQAPFLAHVERFLRGRGLLQTVSSAGDRRYGLPLLYWSAWTAPSLLTQWCLQVGKSQTGRKQQKSGTTPGQTEPPGTQDERGAPRMEASGTTQPDLVDKYGHSDVVMPDWVHQETNKSGERSSAMLESPRELAKTRSGETLLSEDAVILRHTFLVCCLLGEKVDSPRVAEMLDLLCQDEGVMNDSMSEVFLPIPPQDDLLTNAITEKVRKVREDPLIMFLGLPGSSASPGTQQPSRVSIPTSVVAVDRNLAKECVLIQPQSGCSRWYTLLRLLSMSRVNDVNRDGYNLTHTAAFNGELTVVWFLTVNGANLAATTVNGNTPLTKAIDRNNVKVAAFILGQSCRGPQDLKTLCGGRNVDDLVRGAVVCRRVDMLRLLLRHWADPNSRDRKGRSLLAIARAVRADEIVSVLSEFGAK